MVVYARVARATLSFGIVLGALSGMHCERPGWKCGTYLHGSSETIRRCNREDEVCVCASYSCAVPDADCKKTGLRYVDDAYAAPDLRGTCIEDKREVDSALDQRKEASLCPGAGGPEQDDSTSETGTGTGTGSETMTSSGT
jgi:hypothetical protein